MTDEELEKMPDDNVVDLNGKKPKRPLTPKKREQLNRLNANRIPSGTPKGGNGPAGGPGWGGPAKGAGQPYGVKGGVGGRMPNGPERQKRIADRTAAAEELTARLVAMGLNELTEFDEVSGQETPVDVPLTLQHSAIVSALDRLEGKSIQRVAATPGGETVEELRTIDVEKLSLEERDALRRAITQAKEAG